MSKLSSDRRSLRTKKLIKEAFSELLEEKSLNNISIIDLTARADINRGTFYLHYKDKYDLLERIENEIIEALHEQTKNASYLDLLNTNFINTPAPFMINIFEYFKENSTFIKTILGPKGDPLFHNKLKKLIETNLFTKIIKSINQNSILIPEKYFLNYVISAHIGVIQHWLESGMKESPEEMALILSKMFYLGPFKVTGININSSKELNGKI